MFLVSCGGGGGGSKSAKQITNNVPDLAVFFVSGHNPDLIDPPTSYLASDAGPDILGVLEAAGFSIAYDYYIDDANPVNGVGGYVQLVQDMEGVRDQWVPGGTRVVVVAHSHGGVWAHAAIREVNNLTVTCEVDLDDSSFGWDLHASQDDYIGGDPRNEFNIQALVYYPQYPNIPSENTYWYDIEDVVFPNVISALEVRSGDSPDGIEWYDEKWNIRPDMTVGGLYGYYSGTTHEEVHTAGGSTLAFVKGWLLAFL